MIFADKLITLRKKAGWSQEELAEKLENLSVTLKMKAIGLQVGGRPIGTRHRQNFAVSPSVRRDHRLLIKR